MSILCSLAMLTCYARLRFLGSAFCSDGHMLFVLMGAKHRTRSVRLAVRKLTRKKEF